MKHWLIIFLIVTTTASFVFKCDVPGAVQIDIVGTFRYNFYNLSGRPIELVTFDTFYNKSKTYSIEENDTLSYEFSGWITRGVPAFSYIRWMLLDSTVISFLPTKRMVYLPQKNIKQQESRSPYLLHNYKVEERESYPPLIFHYVFTEEDYENAETIEDDRPGEPIDDG